MKRACLWYVWRLADVNRVISSAMLWRNDVLRITCLLVGRHAGLEFNVVLDLNHLGDELVIELAEQELLLLLVVTVGRRVQIVGDVHFHESPRGRCEDFPRLDSVDVGLIGEK